ncbi:cysteine hydrolase [bacterium c-19]|nr:cysteine hydrolase [bacterium c-19]
MARVQNEIIQAYPEMSVNELDHPILFVVDMINGFMKEGALHDKAILKCAKPIKELAEQLQCRNIFVADAHPPHTREFISYPKHCVIGTAESEVISELQPYVEELFHKNSTNAFFAEAFREFLDEDFYYYNDFIITGCCSDICILQFALCLQAYLNEHNECDKRVIVPLNCIETYHIEGVHDAMENNAFAIQNMSANGIHIVSEIKE